MQFRFPSIEALGAFASRRTPVRESNRAIHFAVIGHARSGTTVLLRAINTSPEVYLLGEPFSYRDAGEAGFRGRFNGVHAGFGQQACKSTYAPRLPRLPEDADLETYLEVLGEHYPVYGEKVSLATPRYGHDVARLKDWIESNRTYCLFVFRQPLATLDSMRKLFPSISAEENVYSYAMTMRLYLDLARTLPNIRHFMHERISAKSFKALGAWLKTDLSSAYAYYRRRPSHPRSVGPEGLETLNAAYAFLAKSAGPDGVLSPRIAQNGGKVFGKNGGEIGRIYASLAELMDRLAPFTLAA